MKRLAALLMMLGMLCAGQENLLKNGTFENEEKEFTPCPDFGKWACSLFTEEASWNKCQKIELIQLPQEKNGTVRVTATFYLGRTGKLLGVPVEPDTVYEYSYDARGTFPSAANRIAVWSGDSSDRWKDYSDLKGSVPAIPLEETKWTKCSGTFRTPKNTRRCALSIHFWADSKQQAGKVVFKEGMYLLLDNVVLRKKANPLDGTGKKSSAVFKADYPVCTLPFKGSIDKLYKKEAAPKNKTHFVMADKGGTALHMEVDCLQAEPETISKNAIAAGASIWGKDKDVLELFFGEKQFAVGSTGGLYGAWGKLKPVIAPTDKGWRVTVDFPYELIGKDALLTCNVARGCGLENSSFAPVRDGFKDIKSFARLLMPTYDASVKAAFANAPDAIRGQLAKLVCLPPREKYEAVETLKRQAAEAALGSKKFLLGTVDIHADFSEPFVIYPEYLVDEKKGIAVKGAINDQIPLPLTITNRTDRTESYQVSIHKNSPKNDFEVLWTELPRITMYQGIMMKDDDSKVPTRRFDALVTMNQANLVTVAAGETALVWVTFDTAGMKPGTYKGALRLLPLSEPAQANARKYEGPMLDYPLSVEVLPISLPEDWDREVCLCSRCPDENFFQLGKGMGCNLFYISTYHFLDLKARKIQNVEDIAGWFKKHHYNHKIKVSVAYAAYSIFSNSHKELKPLTLEWREGWIQYLRAVNESMKMSGLGEEEYNIELFDEPFLDEMEVHLEATRLARETLPNVELEITWCCDAGGTGRRRHSPEHIRQFARYKVAHRFWHGLLQRDDFIALIKELRAQGHRCGFYACDTSMRTPLYGYYRLHTWKGVAAGCTDNISLYHAVNIGWGRPGATSWKVAETGGITYRFGNDFCLSVRSEAFRQSMIDFKYVMLLEKTPEGRRFVADMAQKIRKNSSNPAFIREFREGAQARLMGTVK